MHPRGPENDADETHGLDRDVSRMTSGILMARISSVRGKHPLLTHTHPCVAGLKRHRGQRSASAGESGFGGIWLLSEGEHKSRGTRLLPLTLWSAWLAKDRE